MSTTWGNGIGFSVQQVIDCAERVTGRPIRTVRAARRDGDPACLAGCSARIRQDLGWSPKYPDLESMILNAWQWMLYGQPGTGRKEDPQ